MKLLLYTTAAEGVVKRVTAALESSVPDGALETCRSPSNLSRRLQEPKDDLTIVILLLASRMDFLDVLAISHSFRNTHIIVVAPDTREETIAMAHRLRPRYLTYIDGDYLPLSTVVKQIGLGYVEHEVDSERG